MADASGINIEVSHKSQPGTVGAGRVCYATLVVCGWRKLGVQREEKKEDGVRVAMHKQQFREWQNQV